MSRGWISSVPIQEKMRERLEDTTRPAMAQALSARFGGNSASWLRQIERVISGKQATISLEMDDKLRTFLGLQSAWYHTPKKEKVYRVVGVCPHSKEPRTRHWYYTHPTWAQRQADKLAAKGLLLEYSQADVTWKPLRIELPQAVNLRELTQLAAGA